VLVGVVVLVWVLVGVGVFVCVPVDVGVGVFVIGQAAVAALATLLYAELLRL
jgi:hypothetical protein